HAGRLGKDCGICHGSEKWKPSSFDHTRDTTWPLTGQHEKVACHTCHTANVMTQKLPTECVSCHRPNDVHAGSLGKECDQCHTTTTCQGVMVHSGQAVCTTSSGSWTSDARDAPARSRRWCSRSA